MTISWISLLLSSYPLVGKRNDRMEEGTLKYKVIIFPHTKSPIDRKYHNISGIMLGCCFLFHPFRLLHLFLLGYKSEWRRQQKQELCGAETEYNIKEVELGTNSICN